MALKPIRVGTLTILSGQSVSDTFDLASAIASARARGLRKTSVGLLAPALDGVLTVETQRESDSAFTALQSGAPPNPVTFASLESIGLGFFPFGVVRVTSDATETAQREIEVWVTDG